jgi:hypothetical protein
VELSLCRGHSNLVLALSHDHPYDPAVVYSARLVEEAGELFVDITAWVAVIDARSDPDRAAGVDPGIIHPLTVAAADRAVPISGRALRAEEFLPLKDAKARQRHQATKRGPRRARPGQPGQPGCRRWKRSPPPNAKKRPETVGSPNKPPTEPPTGPPVSTSIRPGRPRW